MRLRPGCDHGDRFSHAEAKAKHEPAPKPAVQASKGPFGDIPKGQVEIFVSIDQQKLHLYSDGAHIADTSVATGVPSLPTPLGVFSVIQKQVFHRSNIYSGAPMPFMERITWSGVALHEGESIGHRASHGCIRMPREFAMKLYQLTRIGARVIVANEELKPTEFADPHLFVHKVPSPTPPATPAVAAQACKRRRDSRNRKLRRLRSPAIPRLRRQLQSLRRPRLPETKQSPLRLPLRQRQTRLRLRNLMMPRHLRRQSR